MSYAFLFSFDVRFKDITISNFNLEKQLQGKEWISYY